MPLLLDGMSWTRDNGKVEPLKRSRAWLLAFLGTRTARDVSTILTFNGLPNWGDVPVLVCGRTTWPHGDPTIQASTPRCQILASLSRSDRLAKSLDRRRPSAEAWKRASEVPVTVKRLQGALCRITEARAAPEPGSGTLCLDACTCWFTLHPLRSTCASYGEPRAGPEIYLA